MASVPEGKNAVCFRLTTNPRGSRLTSTLPALISFSSSLVSFFIEGVNSIRFSG